MFADGVDVALEHYPLHVIEQDFSWHATEAIEGQQQRIPHRLERLRRAQADEGHAASRAQQRTPTSVTNGGERRQNPPAIAGWTGLYTGFISRISVCRM